MFSKRCSKCESKIKGDFKFCPSCGLDLRSEYEQEDYGMLGRDDVRFEDQMSFSDSFMEKMFNSAMKVLEKQMKNLGNEMNNQKGQKKNNPGLNVQFFVNGEKISSDGEIKTEEPIKINNNISKDKIKKLSELPRYEPKSKIKRISDKVIYELVVPGVNSIDDVLINQLESSVEIKALSKDKVYLKNLNVNLPILKYQLVNNSLIIEMRAKQ